MTLLPFVANACFFLCRDLHDSYGERGLRILLFPCNQFGSQEPGSNQTIANFVEDKLEDKAGAAGRAFDLYEKLEVNGQGETPIYTWCKSRAVGIMGTTSVKWNFTKFIVQRDGISVQRFSPTTSPASLASDIERALEDHREPPGKQ